MQKLGIAACVYNSSNGIWRHGACEQACGHFLKDWCGRAQVTVGSISQEAGAPRYYKKGLESLGENAS